MMNPAMMHFISEMPGPAAYGASRFTKNAATNAKDICRSSDQPTVDLPDELVRTHRKPNEQEIIHNAYARPLLPLITPYHPAFSTHPPRLRIHINPPSSAPQQQKFSFK